MEVNLKREKPVIPHLGCEFIQIDGRQKRASTDFDGDGVMDKTMVPVPEGRKLIEASVLQIPSVMAEAADRLRGSDASGKIGDSSSW